MRTLLNFVWFITAGLWLAIGYFLAGIVACIFIVTIPAGVASFRMAKYVAWPFGKAVVPAPNAHAGHAIMNGIWFVIAGFWLACAHVITAVLNCASIVGIPLVVVNLKMIPVTCFPFGKVIVDADSLPASARPLHSV